MRLLSALDPAANFRALREFAVLQRRYRGLIVQMARREISVQYSGQVLGLVWAVGHPLFMMALYAFIFGVVFKQRIGGTAEMPLDYTTYILCGLVPWLAFQQGMARACTALTASASLVKQVVFPIEILPVTTVIASFVPQLVGITFVTVYVVTTNGLPPLTYALLPVLVLVQCLAMLGVAFAFAAIGVFLRDLKDFVQLFVQVGMYLMPIVYLPNWVPPLFEPLLYANPFSYMVWCYQDALYFGRFAHPWAWPVFVGGSLFVFVMGYRLFRRLRPHFGDVL